MLSSGVKWPVQKECQKNPDLVNQECFFSRKLPLSLISGQILLEVDRHPPSTVTRLLDFLRLVVSFAIPELRRPGADPAHWLRGSASRARHG
jgi:hypothetical protein